MYKTVIKKFDEIKSLFQKDAELYDIGLVSDLLIKFEEEINLCLKIDENVLKFFKNTSNFRIVADLREFSNQKLKYKLKKSRRANIEKELAKIATAKNFNMEKLKSLLGKPVQIQQKKPITPKKKPASKTQKPKIEDQTSRWLSLTSEQLNNELNDLKRYPDSTALKQASYSILKPNERRFRKREKIINTIIERISEDRAIAHLGR